MSKVLNDVELLFEDTPVVKPRVVKGVKQPKNSLQSVSSWRLVRELLSRHYIDLQVLGFWLAVAAIVWIELGR